jgi:outer membrane autotransporter protein
MSATMTQANLLSSTSRGVPDHRPRTRNLWRGAADRPRAGPRHPRYAARTLRRFAGGHLRHLFGDCLLPDAVGRHRNQDEATPNGGCKPAIWARVIGQSVDNRYQAFADPQATGQILGFQAGFDLWHGSLIPGGTDIIGGYFAYGNANIDVNGLVTNQAATGYVMTRAGSMSLNGYSGGAYWTHYRPSGWYIDAVIQGTGYDGSATTQFANLPLNGSGFVSSLEAGYPFPFPWFGPRFVLEPQDLII